MKHFESVRPRRKIPIPLVFKSSNKKTSIKKNFKDFYKSGYKYFGGTEDFFYFTTRNIYNW